MNKRKIVIAHNWKQFRAWCIYNNLNPYDGRNAMYVTRVDQLCGLDTQRCEIINLSPFSVLYSDERFIDFAKRCGDIKR